MAKKKAKAIEGHCGNLPLREKVRRRDQRRVRLPEVIRMYLQGKPAQVIADHFGLTANQVYRDLRVARDMWKQELEENAAHYLNEELQKVNLIEAEAWEGWIRSKEDAVVRTQEKDKDGKQNRKISRKGQSGEPRFLAIAMDCVDKRCRLLKIGEYSSADSLELQAKAVEVVVESADQVNRILQYDEYDQMLGPSDN